MRGVEPRVAAATFAYAVALAAITVYAQVRLMGGLTELATTQVIRHRDVIEGTSFNPWVYRVLSDLGVEGLYEALRWVGFDRAYEIAFIAFRAVQNVLIFLLAALYYRRLGLTRAAAAIGLGLFAWGLLASYANADLRFDTWSDVIFFLVAGLIVLEGDRAFPWIIPLTAIAALNRETSGMIPVMLAGVALHQGLRTPAGRRTGLIAAAALAVWLAIYLGLRGAIGHRPTLLPYGFGLFADNVTDPQVWINLFQTVAILPFVCLYAWRWWSPPLRVIAVSLVPLWIAIHFFTGSALETRVFAVPFVLVFVPGALVALSRLEPRPRTWGRRLVAQGRAASAARALVAAGGLVLAGSLFLPWYAVQRVDAPFSAAQPGPLTYPSAWDHVPATAIALAILAIAALALAWLRRGGPLIYGARVAVGAVALGVAYRAIAGVPGLDFYPRITVPLSLLTQDPTAQPPRIVPVPPPAVESSVDPRFGAYLAVAAALAILCWALFVAFAERDRLSPER